MHLVPRRAFASLPVLTLVLSTSCRAAGSQADVAQHPASASPAKKLLTLEQTVGRGEKVDFTGTLPDYSWAPDGVHLVLEEKERTVWIDPLTWKEVEPPTESEDDWRGEVERVLVETGVPEGTVKELRPRSMQRAADGSVLVAVADELWWIGADGARALAGADEGEIELPELSPDGAHVAFVQNNDLFVVDTASGELRALTEDGSDDVLNGKLDWVYQEEVYGRGDFKAFWWSPDSRRIAFLRLDETEVHDFTLVDHIEEGHFRVRTETTRYPKVGDPNPVVALLIADAGGAADAQRVDLSAHAAEEPLVVRVDWTPEGDELFYMVQDRIQSWLELCAIAPGAERGRTVLRETSDGWVNRAEAPRWLADRSFLWLSERTGQRHIYRYGRDGTHERALTAGEWSVREIDAVDELLGFVWFSGTRDGVLDDHAYRLPLAGGEPVRLTRAPGRHALRWNGARTLFLDRHSSVTEPPRLLLCDAAGDLERELGVAEAPDLETYATSRWELHQAPARDGFLLDVAVLKPVPFDPARRHPVWLPTYSGPDAPSVSNAWIGSSWYQFLAQNGVIVLQVNVRSASGRGQAVTESVHRQLGFVELADLEDAVAWLCAHPWADPARVGITGGSYGGFMSAYAMTHSDRFALGIAASGVYDWRMYDTIYTERYMSTPALNPDGYAHSSVVGAASSLKGHLVVTHGEMDDNVHLQNAIHLVHALAKAGQDAFELVLYPQSRHGIGDRDLRWFDRRMTWRAIQEHLGAGAAAAETPAGP